MKHQPQPQANGDLKNSPTVELVTFYNKHSGRPAIKKFVNRKTAEMRCAALIAAMAKPEEPAKPKKVPSDADTEARSRGVKSSWKDPVVAAARSQRNPVRVNGEDYKSVRAAYVALELPLKEHIQFRMLLKENGKLENYDMQWSLLPPKTKRSK